MANGELRFESAGDEQRATNLNPLGIGQIGNPSPQLTSLCQGYVVEIERARCGHSVVFREDYFTRNTTDRTGYGNNDNFVEALNHFVTGE